MIATTVVLLCALLANGALAGPDHAGRNLVQLLGPQSVNLWKLDKLQYSRQDYVSNGQEAGQVHMEACYFYPRWFQQPLDHFSNSSDTFMQRYWVNDRHYKPGSKQPTPVFVIDGGETSGADRLPFLDTGIAEILASATGGIGVVLEHRCAVN